MPARETVNTCNDRNCSDMIIKPSDQQQKQQLSLTQLSQATITGKAKTRFIGKHSRDTRLSLFLNQRNSNSPSQLLGLVRINTNALHLIKEKGAVVVVGVMARLLSDHGLQFTEHFLFQKETPIYPAENSSVNADDIIQRIQGNVLGDALLPDEFHRGFVIKLPNALPPSCIFLSPDTSMGPGLTGDSPWGLTYYLYAYLSTQPHHRKSSKVFLSFTRAIPSNPSEIIKETPPPATTVTRSTNRLLNVSAGSNSLILHAALDRPFFYTNEQMAVHVRIENPRSINFTGIRITLKQVITTRALNQTKQIIKVPLAAYEFRSIDSNGKFHGSGHEKCSMKDFPFIIDTLRVNLKPGQNLQHVAVESLLPRNSIRYLLLCPSFAQTYEMQDNPLKYFSVEYYMNVHVIIPWGTNIIAKMPFIVASHGVSESQSSLTTSQASTSADNLATFEVKDSVEELTNHFQDKLENALEPKIDPSEDFHIVIDFKSVKSDLERALKLLESRGHRSNNNNYRGIYENESKMMFVQQRRTWVKEFSEVYEHVLSGLDDLDLLLESIVSGTVRTRASTTKTLLSEYTNYANLLVNSNKNHNQQTQNHKNFKFVQLIIEKFIPLYERFLGCHEKIEHVQILEDSLNQSLDTLELVLMKFHLLVTERSLPNQNISSNQNPLDCEINFSFDELQEILGGRLRKEFRKLTLSIPGMIEWRWLVEELYHLSFTSKNNTIDTTIDNNKNTTIDNTKNITDNNKNNNQINTNYNTEINIKLAQLFQSIHVRLTESFSSSND